MGLRYVGATTKGDFIETVSNDGHGKQWVKDRMSDTANEIDLKFIGLYPRKIVVYNDNNGTIVYVLNTIHPKKYKSKK